MAENIVDGLEGVELDDFSVLVNNTIKEICLFADKYNFDRDNMLAYCRKNDNFQ